jgi:hypothetical protein
MVSLVTFLAAIVSRLLLLRLNLYSTCSMASQMVAANAMTYSTQHLLDLTLQNRGYLDSHPSQRLSAVQISNCMLFAKKFIKDALCLRLIMHFEGVNFRMHNIYRPGIGFREKRNQANSRSCQALPRITANVRACVQTLR